MRLFKLLTPEERERIACMRQRAKDIERWREEANRVTTGEATRMATPKKNEK